MSDPTPTIPAMPPQAAPAPTPMPAPKPVRRAVEKLAAEKGTKAWLFAAAKIGQRWAIGAELTEAEYDKAIEAARNVKLR